MRKGGVGGAKDDDHQDGKASRTVEKSDGGGGDSVRLVLVAGRQERPGRVHTFFYFVF